MSLECKCDECNKYIDSGEDTICRVCHGKLLDEISAMEDEIHSLTQEVEMLKDQLNEKEDSSGDQG